MSALREVVRQAVDEVPEETLATMLHAAQSPRQYSEGVELLIRNGVATPPINRVIGQHRTQIKTTLDVGAMLDADRGRLNS